MFKGKKAHPESVEKIDSSGTDTREIPEGNRFFHCLDCNHVWHNPVPYFCPKCASIKITECSEFFYDLYTNKNSL